MEWLILIALVLVVVVVAVVALNKRRSAQLRDRFGPEYERAVDRHGDRRSAESELRERLDRRRHTDLRELTEDDRDRYAGRWRVVQGMFVDDPRRAVEEGAMLVEQVMAERGYLASGDDTSDDSGDDAVVHDRYELVAVDHPELVEHYRSTRAGDVGSDSVDGLRQAFLRHRELFEALVHGDRARETEEVARA